MVIPDAVENFERRVRSVLVDRDIRKIVIGVSGGADSVALLLALHRIKTEILAVNCNFHLRGNESDRDSRFVKDLCRRLDIPLISLDFDVEDYISRNGGSVEMACRDLRYSEFFRIKEEKNADRVAVAHNSDDQVETVLLNLLRGGGVKGLRGMKEDTGSVIRPLLTISREEIENYLSALQQTFIVDSSNRESLYRRNFIRNELLPLIETRWPRARKSILKTASIMEKEERALDFLESRFDLTQNILGKEEIMECFDPSWLIRRFVLAHGGDEELAGEVSRWLVGDTWRSGKMWTTQGGEFHTSSHGLEWLPSSSEGNNGEKWRIEMYTNSESLMNRIRLEKDNNVFWTSIPPEEIEFRHPECGDRIRPLGMHGSRLVSDVIKDAKLSASEKRSLYLAVRRGDGEVLWVEGIKRSCKGLILPENKIIWRIVRNKESNC